MIPCISIRQPWALFIMLGWKPVENRTWATQRRGRVLIHAAKGMTHEEYFGAWLFARRTCGVSLEDLKEHAQERMLVRGAILGSVDITDCVTKHPSPWFVGPHGFVVRDPVRFETPIPYKGALSFFGVPSELVKEAA